MVYSSAILDETLWLSQALIAELFQKDVRTVNEILTEVGIDAHATIRKFRTVHREEAREVGREMEHDNLDAIWPWATGCGRNVAPSSAVGRRSA